MTKKRKLQPRERTCRARPVQGPSTSAELRPLVCSHRPAEASYRSPFVLQTSLPIQVVNLPRAPPSTFLISALLLSLPQTSCLSGGQACAAWGGGGPKSSTPGSRALKMDGLFLLKSSLRKSAPCGQLQGLQVSHLPPPALHQPRFLKLLQTDLFCSWGPLPGLLRSSPEPRGAGEGAPWMPAFAGSREPGWEICAPAAGASPLQGRGKEGVLGNQPAREGAASHGASLSCPPAS